MKSPLIGKKGTVLLLTLILLSFLTAFGAILISLVSGRLEAVTLEVDRTKAFCLAEAGINRSFQEIKQESDLDGNGVVGSIAETSLGDGSYEVIHNITAQTMISTGTVNDTSRKIEVIYEK